MEYMATHFSDPFICDTGLQTLVVLLWMLHFSSLMALNEGGGCQCRTAQTMSVCCQMSLFAFSSCHMH